MSNLDIKNLLGLDKSILNLADCNRGLEKESLRISKKFISKKDHPKSLGSALFNKYITTDFSESLVELISPPQKSYKATIRFIELVEKFVNQNIEDEFLWSFSIPPSNIKESDIRIAEYGTSNLAKFKHYYRLGLSHRYGRYMQAIAGIHYNFSLPDNFFLEILENKETLPRTIEKNNIYLSTIRNLQRMNWLLLFLFGSSPIVIEQLISNQKYRFKKHKDVFYHPFATSIRMSDLGYRNNAQSNISISLNSLDDYISNLRAATSTESGLYREISKRHPNKRLQLNESFLQIEDEYYSSVRPKSSMEGIERTTKKIAEKGIDYIEIRSMDLDPCLTTGISENEMKFLDLFIIFALCDQNRPISSSESEEIQKNDLNVSIFGRKQGLTLRRMKEKISLKDWGNEILDGIEDLSELLNIDINIHNYRESISNPTYTKSSKVLDQFIDSGEDYMAYGEAISMKNKIALKEKKEDSMIMKLIKDEVCLSILKQQRSEIEEDIEFDDYLRIYFQ